MILSLHIENIAIVKKLDIDMKPGFVVLTGETGAGKSIIIDSLNLIGNDEYLLPNATTISLDEAPDIIKSYGGVCYPAHIDRDSNGIIAILGTVPPTPVFSCVEIRSPEKVKEYTERYSLSDKTVVVSSDAHYLTDINETNNFFELDAEPDDPAAVRRELFKLLNKI